MQIILDGNSIAYRAYHKAPPLTAPDGTPTGAVHVFFTILESVRARLKTTNVIAVFDASGPTVRHEMYAEYKANRESMPEDLAIQIGIIRELLPIAGIPVYRKSGIEADDIIATLARRANEPVAIVTKDKDLFQLVSDTIKIYDDQTGRLLDSAETKLKYGVSPEEMLSYLSLLGDKSDNIPGVMGVGEKTAAKLVSEFGSLDEIYANIDSHKGKLRENLLRDKDSAYRAKELILLQSVEMFEPVYAPDNEKLKDRLTELGMRAVAVKLLTPSNTEIAMNTSAINIDVPALLDFPTFDMGVVAVPELFVAVDNDLWVIEDGQYEHFDEIRHNINNAKKFYDVKEFSKNIGKTFGAVRDYLLISWLCEPDNGAIRKSKTESMEQFSARLFVSAKTLDKKLSDLNLIELYDNLELPATYILANAEKIGIHIAPDQVKTVAHTLKQYTAIVASRIMNKAGYEINLNSPKQLSEYLYGNLGIKPLGKNKLSTAEDVLLELMPYNEEHRGVLQDILTYREYSKLLSTYTQTLLDVVAEDGRIHTTYKQTGTATGRLSSVNPNLQNIPARGDIGIAIRRAFTPADGYKFVTLDYSQIELRVLAHLSGDPSLHEAFANNQDIHTTTAMKIFNKSESEVTSDYRRLAKAVNFGILYGLSAFGLSRDTGVSTKEAKEFIDAYFSLYGSVKQFIDNTINNTKKNGYCETLLGRKRFFPDINSRNGLIRQRAERAAMNAPIQGSAADIIKLAMLKCDKVIMEQAFEAQLILQIHDELLFEVHNDHVETFLPAVQTAMETAYALNVPLAVNSSVGENWGDLK